MTLIRRMLAAGLLFGAAVLGMGQIPGPGQVTFVVPIVSALANGAHCDGITDDSVGINAAIVVAHGLGGGQVIVPCKTVFTTGTVNNPYSNVVISGLGGDFNHNVGSECGQAGTTWTWGGAAGGTIVDLTPTGGASAQIPYGGGVTGVCLNGNSVAGIGINVNNRYAVVLQNIFLNEFTTEGMIWNTGGTFGESTGVQMAACSHIGGRQIINAAPVIVFTGGATGNSSITQCSDIDVIHKNANGIELRTSDNVILENVRTFRDASAGACTGTNTCNSARFFASGTNGLQANNNIIRHLSANSAPVLETTTVAANAVSGIGFPDMDSANSTPAPITDGGAAINIDLGWYTYTGKTAWSAWVPVISCASSGAPTYSISSARNVQRQDFSVSITILFDLTAVNTCTGNVQFTLPTSANAQASFSGRDSATGSYWMAVVAASSNLAVLFQVSSSGGTPSFSSNFITLSGTYESK